MFCLSVFTHHSIPATGFKRNIYSSMENSIRKYGQLHEQLTSSAEIPAVLIGFSWGAWLRTYTLERGICKG